MKSQREHFLIDLAIREGKFEDFVNTVRLMTPVRQRNQARWDTNGF